MSPLAQLKSISDQRYTTEDGDEYGLELLPGLNGTELDEFASRHPGGRIPSEIRELLAFAKGFDFLPLDLVTFDALDFFGFEEAFPHAIDLARDGLGNSWVIDVTPEGDWGHIYYVCHDPPVIVKQSSSLAEFIAQVGEYGRQHAGSAIDSTHEEVAFQVYEAALPEIREGGRVQSFDDVEVELPARYFVADLQDAPLGAGFAWGKTCPDPQIIRPTSAPRWIVEHRQKPHRLRLHTRLGGWWSRRFGS